ncbi:16007_t:CDS:1, partial [Cetraspora pellucida]
NMTNIDETKFNLHLSLSRRQAYYGQLAIHTVVNNKAKILQLLLQ